MLWKDPKQDLRSFAFFFVLKDDESYPILRFKFRIKRNTFLPISRAKQTWLRDYFAWFPWIKLAIPRGNTIYLKRVHQISRFWTENKNITILNHSWRQIRTRISSMDGSGSGSNSIWCSVLAMYYARANGMYSLGKPLKKLFL